jgi:LAS superfamily LD-carboxypeptidase LdcB
VTQNLDQVCGLADDHLCVWDNNVLVHRRLADPLRALTQAALCQGIRLNVASGFRSFERQRLIWNDKATGRRPVLGDRGEPVDIEKLSDVQLMYAILRWSALPGASRHHWGTDLDVWDGAAVSADYRLQLTTDEYSEKGPFARLGRWLASGEVHDLGFSRPYTVDRGGIAPEPWHLTYRPLAMEYERQLTSDGLAAVIARSDVALANTVIDHIDDIFTRFVSL